jgi:hypothetical protein
MTTLVKAKIQVVIPSEAEGPAFSAGSSVAKGPLRLHVTVIDLRSGSITPNHMREARLVRVGELQTLADGASLRARLGPGEAFPKGRVALTAEICAHRRIFCQRSQR